MKNIALFLVPLALCLLSCENETHSLRPTDQEETAPDEQENVDDATVVDLDTAVADLNDIGGPDNDTTGTDCQLDSECDGADICVAGNCVPGCTGNGDCAAYPGTTCNTVTHRCFNEVADDGACDETNCPTGCCYAERGFRKIACLIPPSLEYCGMCPQGQVYMNRAECVPAACSTTDTKCRDYNSYEMRAACYECKASDLLCYDNPACN